MLLACPPTKKNNMPNETSGGEKNRVIDKQEIDNINQSYFELTKETENAPIFIPAHATRQEQIKSSGYRQIKYKWTVLIHGRKHTFEARLHTATLYAPVGTPSNWRITRFVHGTPTGEAKIRICSSRCTSQYVGVKEWHEAARAFVQQTATEKAQKNRLKRGHFKENN